MGHCIKSFVKQKLPNVENNFIYSATTVGTNGAMEIQKRNSRKDLWIKVIHSEQKNYGHQMNYGLPTSNRECIGIIETGDFVSTEISKELMNTQTKVIFISPEDQLSALGNTKSKVAIHSYSGQLSSGIEVSKQINITAATEKFTLIQQNYEFLLGRIHNWREQIREIHRALFLFSKKHMSPLTIRRYAFASGVNRYYEHIR